MLQIEMKQDDLKLGFGHSSKGNQMKWLQDGYWYKADQFGYESLAEVVVSHLLQESSVADATLYEPVVIIYKGKEYRGCRSENFRSKDEVLIPLERLFRNYTTIGLAKQLARISSVKERILYTEEITCNITKLENCGKYLATMLEMDAFFLNEDRHTNNISILYNKEMDTYRLCPFYDMGLSLFADTKVDFPLEMDYFLCKEKIIAKPFSRDYDEQMDGANELYGSYLKFHFSSTQITDVITKMKDNFLLSEANAAKGAVGGYTMEEFQRVEETLRYQATKYGVFFDRNIC